MVLTWAFSTTDSSLDESDPELVDSSATGRVRVGCRLIGSGHMRHCDCSLDRRFRVDVEIERFGR
jgi:hypothetical protein